MSDLARLGWARFPVDPAVRAWAEAARRAAVAALSAPRHAHWWRHRDTWFVGVDALASNAEGRVAGGPPLAGAVIEATGWAGPWHRAQVSAVRPGYPKRDPGESESAHRYRATRDAAHVDGLHAEGPARRRHLREPHAFILGLPLTAADPGASPLVVWEGSHDLMRAAFRAAFAGLDPARWSEVDVTDAYHEARRDVFASCKRIEMPVAPGEAVLLHRLALHGVAPWAAVARAAPEGRLVAYFRPLMPGGAEAWLSAP